MASSRVPLSVSQTTLPEQNVNRNQPGLNSQTPMGPNAYDGFSNAAFDGFQQLNNNRFQNQSQTQNLITAASQASANAMDNVRTSASNESSAQNLLNQRIAEATFANLDMQGNQSTMNKMGQMGSEQLTAIKRRVAIGKTQAEGLNPDLGDYAGSVSQYS